MANIPFFYAISLFLFFLFSGTFGYYLIEHWSILDSFYMTLITLTTIGYGEIHPLSNQGRVFTIFLIIFGVGAMAYITTTIFQYVVTLRFDKYLHRRKLEKKMNTIQDHTILCGVGQMGKEILKGLLARGQKVVIIEKLEDKEEILKTFNIPYVIGNASDDEVLIKAGIHKAKNLVAVTTTDAENVFVVLSAKAINPKVRTISRVFDESSRAKLMKAGTDKIISPYIEASIKIREAIINPDLDDFMEIITEDHAMNFKMADIVVQAGNSAIGKTLAELKLKERGVLIVGIKKRNGHLVFAPHKNEAIEPGDKLMAIGQGENFADLMNDLVH